MTLFLATLSIFPLYNFLWMFVLLLNTYTLYTYNICNPFYVTVHLNSHYSNLICFQNFLNLYFINPFPSTKSLIIWKTRRSGILLFIYHLINNNKKKNFSFLYNYCIPTAIVVIYNRIFPHLFSPLKKTDSLILVINMKTFYYCKHNVEYIIINAYRYAIIILIFILHDE